MIEMIVKMLRQASKEQLRVIYIFISTYLNR